VGVSAPAAVAEMTRADGLGQRSRPIRHARHFGRPVVRPEPTVILESRTWGSPAFTNSSKRRLPAPAPARIRSWSACLSRLRPDLYLLWRCRDRRRRGRPLPRRTGRRGGTALGTQGVL